MRILLTGAKGMLGQEVVRYFQDRYEVFGTGKEEIDITNYDSIVNYVEDVRPHIVINCAALSSAEIAEKNMEKAFKLNAIGARNLAIASDLFDFKLVHISSEHVFDGTSKTAYIETDQRQAINVLGKSKIDGENFIKEITHKYFIIRSQWIFGLEKNDFVRTMLERAKTEDAIKVINDQFGCPTYIKDLLGAIEEVMLSKKFGVYHVTNAGFTSWFEFTKTLYTLAGINSVVVLPCSSDEIKLNAQLPKNRILKGFYFELEGFTPLRGYQQALEEFVKTL